MAAGIGSEDHAGFSRNRAGWWVPREGSVQATVLDANESMTAENVLQKAHLDWLVEKVPSYDLWKGEYRLATRKVFDKKTGREKKPEIVDFRNRRTDTGLIVGTGIGARYEVYQNADALAFTDFIAGEGYTFDTAGSLFNCSTVWVLMDSPEDVVLNGDARETLKKWLLITNTHDGSGAVTVAVVVERVVCANTLAWALEGAQRTFKVRHTAAMHERLEDAAKALKMASNYEAKFKKQAEALIDLEIGEDGIMKMLDELQPLTKADGEPKTGRALTTVAEARDTIMGIHNGADNLKHLPQTSAYRFVNAVAEYGDHFSIFRNTDGNNAGDNRMWKLAEGKTIGDKAFKLAEKLLVA